MITKVPVIQRDPNIKFMCLSEWFRESICPSYETYVPVSELYAHYTNWVMCSDKWNVESLTTLPVFSKQLTILLHANDWKYVRVKKDGTRGYYGVTLHTTTPS